MSSWDWIKDSLMNFHSAMEANEMLVPGRLAVFSRRSIFHEADTHFCVSSLNLVHIVNNWFCKFQGCIHFRFLFELVALNYFSIVSV